LCSASFEILPAQQPNGWRYRQGRDLADKTTRRRIRRWGQSPESVGKSPHLSGARGVGLPLWMQDSLTEQAKTTKFKARKEVLVTLPKTTLKDFYFS
jgi:hypothetical protein